LNLDATKIKNKIKKKKIKKKKGKLGRIEESLLPLSRSHWRGTRERLDMKSIINYYFIP
jgi:hypothetical protein